MGKEEVLAIAPLHDTKGKRDATRAFIPEAHRFIDYWESQGLSGRVVCVDNRATNPVRRSEMIHAIAGTGQLRHLAIFAHGWRTGIQFGFRRNHLAALARHLDAVAVDDSLVVTLYCCSTAQGAAGGDGGFADELRDALCERGLMACRVDAHTNKGHTTRNPYVRRFEGEGSSYGGQGGHPIVRPRGKHWARWKAALRDRDDPLRYRFPQMGTAEVHDWLWAVA